MERKRGGGRRERVVKAGTREVTNVYCNTERSLRLTFPSDKPNNNMMLDSNSNPTRLHQQLGLGTTAWWGLTLEDSTLVLKPY